MQDKESFGINLEWKHARRTWLDAKMPIFFDLGATFMIWIKQWNYGTSFTGRVITKYNFLKKYRKRLPTPSFMQ
jgi:hypothetical protein